jgi:hypothetical protein
LVEQRGQAGYQHLKGGRFLAQVLQSQDGFVGAAEWRPASQHLVEK